MEAFIWTMVVLNGLSLAMHLKDYYNGIFPVPNNVAPLTKN